MLGSIYKKQYERQTSLRSIRTFLILVATVLGLAASPAMAQNAVINEAKAKGQIGEMYDGYLGFVVGGVSNSVRDNVRKVNSKRREAYVDLAKKGGISVAVAGALTGEKLIKRAKKGEYVKGQDGRWVRR